MKAVLFLELLLAVLAGIQTPEQKGAIALEGVVLERATGKPIAGAKLKLEVIGNAPMNEVAGVDGKFAFRNLAAGAYRLYASSNGFVTQEYGALLTGGPGRVITVTVGESRNFTIALTPAATASGHTRDAAGAPLAGVRVELLRRIWTADGFEILDSVAVARTNDLGEYRIYWVAPGSYYLLAGSHEPERLTSSSVNEERASYACTFFGATDPQKLTPVELLGGIDSESLDFTLARLTFHRVSGRAFDPTGKPPTGLNIEVHRSGVDVCPFKSAEIAKGRYDAASGTFQSDPVPTGTYSLQLFGGSADGWLSAITTVTVGNSNVEDVRAVLGPRTFSPGIHGTVRIEGEPAPAWRPHWVGLRPVGRGPFTGFPKSLPPWEMEQLGGVPACLFLRFRACERIEEDGFLLHGVADGAYRIATAPLPRGYYLKAAMLDDVDVLSHPLSFPASGNLTLVISPNAGVVDGVVVDESSMPVSGIEAVLIPDNGRERGDLFRQVTTDGSGKFRIENVAPGSYKVFAWQALEPYTYFDPDVLRRFEDRGVAARVAESSHVTVRVSVIPEGSGEGAR
jgi:hypothetical protein